MAAALLPKECFVVSQTFFTNRFDEMFLEAYSMAVSHIFNEEGSGIC